MRAPTLLPLMLAACRADPPAAGAPPVDSDPAIDSPAPADSPAADSPADSPADTGCERTPAGALALDLAPLPADGASRREITITRADGCAAPPTLTSTMGRLGALTPVGDGAWRAALTAGNVPGVARLALVVEGAEVDAAVLPLDAGAPYSMQLHVHGPLSEGDSTHAFQAREAAAWGVDLLWWTDHDYLYFPALKNTLYEADWSAGDAIITAPTGEPDGPSYWLPGGDAEVVLALAYDDDLARGGAPSVSIGGAREGGADWAWASASWQAPPTRVHYPLLSDVQLALSVRAPAGWDPGAARLRVELPMSVVEEGAQRVIWLVDRGDDAPVEGEGAVVIPVDWRAGDWADVSLDLSALAADGTLPEGLDLSVRGLVAWIGLAPGAEATFHLGGLRAEDRLQGEDLRAAQRALLEGHLSSEVRHLVGHEISWHDREIDFHLTAFGAGVAFPDYDAISLGEDFPEAVGAARAAGGLVAATHPFGAHTVLLPDWRDTVDAALVEACDHLDAVGIYGADLLEAGYPARVYELSTHLALWDCLTARGHVVTGIGTSDTHWSQAWAEFENRYVTWALPHGDGEAALLDALRAGRAFFGDPVLMAGRAPLLDLRIEGRAAMGQVLDGLEAAPLSVTALLAGAAEGDTLRWILDGALAAEDAAADGEHALEITPGAWSWVRAELRDAEGQGLLVSNPIYLSTGEVAAAGERAPSP